MRNLTAAFLLVTVCGLFPCTSAEGSIQIEIDPGEVGETFATKSFDLPELVGMAATDETVELAFTFADGKFVNSSIFFAGAFTFELVVQYDRPFADNQIMRSFPFDPSIRGFGHVTDEDGNRLNYPGSFGEFGPTAPVRLRVGPDRPEDAGPGPGATTSDAYYGAFLRYGFFLPVGEDAPIIESASLSFLDTRFLWPNPAPLPHLVGQATIPPSNEVPEPGSIVAWSLLGIVAVSFGWHRRQDLASIA